MDKSIKIVVATHKKYKMPENGMYLPLHVGAFGKESIGYQRDDEGENISNLNQYFCELTGLYWAWKNLKEDYIGLVHYRRLFEMGGKILQENQIKPLLDSIKVFVPKKRWYVIETLQSHYEHTHFPEHIQITREVIKENKPDYISSFDKAMKQRWGYMFNMMIVERSLLNEYCTWLFDILSVVFSRIDTTGYSDFMKRYIGRLSELLFNVWIIYKLDNKLISKKEIIELNYKTEEKILKKIPAFLKAKFLGEKYTKSF